MNAPDARRSPIQSRSKATVEALLDATAQVLVAEGYDRASTNRIARRAGVSIGTLYQYFSSKEALVRALVQRHTAEMLALLAAHVGDLRDAPLPEAIRTYVRAMLRAHAVAPDLHRVLVHEAIQSCFDCIQDSDARARALVRVFLAHRQAEIRPRDLDTATFVLVTSVEAVTHAAVLTGLAADPARLARLEDELVALVTSYLTGTTA